LVWTTLTECLERAMRAAGWWSDERPARLELAVPRDPAHGDWTTNLALLLARELKRPPRAVAEELARRVAPDPEVFAGVEVAGPGFLNFRYSPAFLRRLPATIVAAGGAFGAADHAHGLPVLVEYVSANPTGPLNVVNARAAAVGAALVRLLEATGHQAAGEFYVNDAGNQVDLLGESVAARVAEWAKTAREFPENGYRGSYVGELAEALWRERRSEAEAGLARPDGAAWFRDQALERMQDSQRRDLASYGAEFALWFRESSLHASGRVAGALAALEERGVVYEAEGARWLRTTGFGDDKDRVIVRSNGVPTYLLPDIAYHLDKRARGFRHAVNLWGPDHHAYVGTLQAALRAVGLEPDFLEVLIVQQVNLMKFDPAAGHSVPYKMSKRAGEFITLRDLIEEVGADCAKFFFLMRSTSAHLDFDLDLARQQNDENPAYYVQYAHARIASILRFAAGHGLTPDPGGTVALDAAEEIALIRRLASFPEVVRGAALAREPHRIPTYLVETAAEFHRFYHACRVVSDDAARSRGRLLLAAAARTVLANGLALMGVTAPERMERAAEALS